MKYRLLPFVQSRRDESPDLVKDDGHGEEEAAEQADLEVGEERLGNADVL